MERDEATKRKISKGMKRYYAEMSVEERKAISDKMSATRQRKEMVYRFFCNNVDYFKRIAEWKREKGNAREYD